MLHLPVLTEPATIRRLNQPISLFMLLRLLRQYAKLLQKLLLLFPGHIRARVHKFVFLITIIYKDIDARRILDPDWPGAHAALLQFVRGEEDGGTSAATPTAIAACDQALQCLAIVPLLARRSLH